jgi:hypothetical protein
MFKDEINYDVVKDYFDANNYDFKMRPFEMNIVGIRTSNPIVNRWDDFLCWLYIDESLNKKLEIFPATTDPGIHYLENPMDTHGCAILCPGNYPKMWIKGMHRAKYSALIQNASCSIWRDPNRDDKLDIIPGVVFNGNFGINNHYKTIEPTEFVDIGSAGCQVYELYEDFIRAMYLRDQQIKNGWGEIFDYTLVNEGDLFV